MLRTTAIDTSNMIRTPTGAGAGAALPTPDCTVLTNCQFRSRHVVCEMGR